LGKNEKALDQMIHDLGSFSHTVAQASGTFGNLQRPTENMARISSKVNNIADAVNDMVAAEPTAWETDGHRSLRNTVDELNHSLEHLNAIARKIDEGQGTVGRLVNDPSTADKVEQTLDDVSAVVGPIGRLQTQIELRGEYAMPLPGADRDQVPASIKNTLGVRIIPKPDKYYLIEAVSDPRGKQTRTVTSTTTPASGGTTTSVEQTVIAYDQLKFSLMFAKRYYFLTLRFGIIENSGGVGANLHALSDRLELRFDAFDFTRRDPVDNSLIFPRLRGIAMLEVINHLHVQAGVDDPLNQPLRTWFAGGVLRFNDDDLKALLTVAPKAP